MHKLINDNKILGRIDPLILSGEKLKTYSNTPLITVNDGK